MGVSRDVMRYVIQKLMQTQRIFPLNASDNFETSKRHWTATALNAVFIAKSCQLSRVV